MRFFSRLLDRFRRIDWNEVRCPSCEAWEAEQEGSAVAPRPCKACKRSMKKYGRLLSTP